VRWRCTAMKIPIYGFLFWELRGISPYFLIHVSVRDLYIFLGLLHAHIWLQPNRQANPGNINISDRYMSVLGIKRQNITILFWK
jgi:hypothetical protein